MSSEDADDECESPAPPVPEWVDPRTLQFTVFIVLPSEEVCTLRDLPSGISVLDIKARLEVSAGLPSQMYGLVYPDGEELPPTQRLVVRENIIHGYILKVKPIDSWESLYLAVSRNNIEQVYHSGGVHLRGNIQIAPEEAGRYESVVRERGTAALYMAAYLGRNRMANMLVSVGVNPNGATMFGRTSLHAAVARDQVGVMDYLVTHGASLDRRDSFGHTPMDIALQFNSVLCYRKIRLMLLNLRGHSSGGVKKTITSSSKSKEGISDKERAKTAMSQYSDVSSISKPTCPVHVSRKQLSSSAPAVDMRHKLNDTERTHSSLSLATTGKVRQKYNVKWKETSTEYTFWNLGDMSKIEDSVKVKQVSYSLPKTILKFSSVNAAKSGQDPKREKENKLKEEVADKKPESPEIVQAMKYSKEKLKHFKKMTKTHTEYVPMADRKKKKYSATNHASNKEASEAFKRWLEKKEEEEEYEKDDSDEQQRENGNISDSDEEKMFEFNKRVRKMNKSSTRSLTPGNRPVMNIIEFGSTKQGDGRNPPAEQNITAYNEWKRKKRVFTIDVPRVKSTKDFEAEKRRLEERRQKLLMNAISYEEWMDHTEERKTLIKQILKADMEDMRKMEDDKVKDRHRLYSYDLWRDRLRKRETEDRKRKEVQKLYDQERHREKEESRSSYAVPFDDWLKRKRSAMTKERESEQRLSTNGKRDVNDKKVLDAIYRQNGAKGQVTMRDEILRNSAPVFRQPTVYS
ncbi:ANK2-like protein [Mya arenaria]|uniref:ANK2-like protein n=1 Tax=Mya arenaria TaxID=6604 RepID=A0ABY7ESF6_MYAAR|nr:uncharacterized protein LOC128242591 [Mya arenaria]XP_052815767.1 uncharacterized protein LOC128242591 [Mya arenaria]XP_052815768.1 uncharacterized protein LOC128242591 [Mya arenaria]WAR12898.1 ANK2-like protein [Mya arenaria]